jgi:CheY-like chemotaxis protein
MEKLPAVLLVDDEVEILDFLERILKSKYHIFRANNGMEALELLKAATVHLIICDVMMPKMDGFELCKIIKSKPETAYVPIILLTAKNTLQSKIAGLEMSADAYIEKPFSKEHLLAQISSLLANREIIRNHLAASPLVHIKGPGHSKEDERFLELLNDYILKNMEDEKLDVKKLAKMMNMSRITLYRKIKTIARLRAVELISLTRLKKAAELLAEGEYKVYEVSLMVGYSSQSNFTRDFHKQFNITPSDFMTSRKSG